MHDVIVGVLAVLAGSVVCFRGYWALRLVISVWGAFVGFAVGAGVIASVSGDNFLATFVGWMFASVLALIFAALAYFYYAIGIVLATASAGFAVGAGIVLTFNSSWTWLPAIIGLVVGVLAAVLAIAADLPLVVLIVVGAVAGASAVVSGVMLMVGALSTTDLDSSSIAQSVEHEGWWAALALVLVIAGVLVQSRTIRWAEHPHGTWVAAAHRDETPV